MYKLKIVIDLHVPTRYGFLEGGGGATMYEVFFKSLCHFGFFSSKLIGWTRNLQYTRHNLTQPLLTTNRIQNVLQNQKLSCLRADISIFPHQFFSMVSEIILYPAEARNFISIDKCQTTNPGNSNRKQFRFQGKVNDEAVQEVLHAVLKD